MTQEIKKINFFSQEEMNRGWKYLAVGLITFLLDLLLLFLFVEYLFIREFIAAGISFLLMVTLNYVLNRRFAFAGTETGIKQGYPFFTLFAVLGALVTSGLMYLCVDYLDLNYFASRIPIALFVSISTYFLNYFFTFKLNKAK